MSGGRKKRDREERRPFEHSAIRRLGTRRKRRRAVFSSTPPNKSFLYPQIKAGKERREWAAAVPARMDHSARLSLPPKLLISRERRKGEKRGVITHA